MRKSTLHRITIVVVAVGLSQRLREADDRIVNDERRSGRAHWTCKEARSQTAVESVNNAYLAAKNPWLQRQLHASLRLGDLPFVVGRGPVAGEGLPPLWPDLKLHDTVPFRLSRNHFMIEKRDGSASTACTSFSRLRLELQFGARLYSGIADPTRRSKEAPAFAAVSAVVTDDTDEARRAT